MHNEWRYPLLNLVSTFLFHSQIWLPLATNFLTFWDMGDFINRRANWNDMALLSLLQEVSLQHAFEGTLSSLLAAQWMKISLIQSGFNIFFCSQIWLPMANNFLTLEDMGDFVNRRANWNDMALLSLSQAGSLQHAFEGTLSSLLAAQWMKILLIKSGFNLFFHSQIWLSLATNFCNPSGYGRFCKQES